MSSLYQNSIFLMKIITIIGARPQFIKASAITRAINKRRNDSDGEVLEEILLHTGQHYDEKMSGVFFDELDITKPKYNLGIKANSHGAMTGQMLEQIEKVLLFGALETFVFLCFFQWS